MWFKENRCMDFCFVYTNVLVQFWIAISLQKLQVFQLTAVKNITLCWVSIAVWQPKRHDSFKVETCVSLLEMYLRLLFLYVLEMYLRKVFLSVSVLEMYLRLVFYVREMYLRQVFLSVSLLEMYLWDLCFEVYLRCTWDLCFEMWLRCTWDELETCVLTCTWDILGTFFFTWSHLVCTLGSWIACDVAPFVQNQCDTRFTSRNISKRITQENEKKE